MEDRETERERERERERLHRSAVKFCAKLISGATMAYCQVNGSSYGRQEIWRSKAFEELRPLYVYLNGRQKTKGCPDGQ